MSKPGRNDPCYCGSEKKYKQCHMAEDKAADKEKRQLSDAGQWLRRDLLKFARDERFTEYFAIALSTYWNGYYTIENAEEMSQNEAFRFFDWFVFDYQHEESPRLIEVYYQENFEDVSLQQQKVLEQWRDAPPASAYELLQYEGQQLNVRDFVDGETFVVYESAGHGPVQPGDLLLGRLVPVVDQLEFSTIAAYLPQDEIANLDDKLEEARTKDAESYPEATQEEFMRRNGYIIIHHALEQAELHDRPPVAGSDPNRADELVRKAATRLRKLQQRTLS